MSGAYAPLSSDLVTGNGTEDDSSIDGQAAARPGWRRFGLIYFAITVCILCTIANATLVVLSSSHVPGPSGISQLPAMLTRDELGKLRRPSHFMGFEDVPRQQPPIPKQLSNYPLLLTQVDSSHPAKVFQDDPRRLTTAVGTISPEDRRVLVTETISTIVQFRAVDYGMESCELVIRLPEASSVDVLNPAQAFPLSLYRLNSSLPLDIRSLSFSTLPQRMAKLGDVPFAYGSSTTWSRTLRCRREEVLTFELSCSPLAVESECALVWWQDRESPQPALFMIQHSTL